MMFGKINSARLFVICLFLGITFSTNVHSIKVLTYNICWECMSNSNRGTAAALGQMCKFIPMRNLTGRGTIRATQCALNLANTIDAASTAYGGLAKSFDFVGLQEATNWQNVQQISKSLSNMQATGFNIGVDSFVSFYGKQYQLVKQIRGGLVPNSRPFQILIFRQPIIFINIHAPHGFSKAQMEAALSKALMGQTTQRDRVKYRSYRIIVAGDFNDHSPREGSYWLEQLREDRRVAGARAFAPFSGAGIPTRVYLAQQPPATCCSTAIPMTRRMPFRSDYIFDSVRTNVTKPWVKLEVPTNYQASTPKSDHLPLIYETP